MNITNYVHELNGYLKLLQRMVPNVLLAANYIDIEKYKAKGVDSILSEFFDINILTRRKVSYDEVDSIFDAYILSQISCNSATKKIISWDFFEFFGLMSTSEESCMEFNKIIENGCDQISYISKNDKESVCFLLEYASFLVLVFFERS